MYPTSVSYIIFIFRKDIAEIFSGLFQFKNNESFWFSVKIVLSMIPAICIGLFFESEIEALFGGQLILVGGMLLLTGGLLFLADKIKISEKEPAKPMTSGFMGAGVAGAIAGLVLLGFIVDSKVGK